MLEISRLAVINWADSMHNTLQVEIFETFKYLARERFRDLVVKFPVFS